ncbi:hypothetical protein ACLOJK_003088 [Asimina triloba]
MERACCSKEDRLSNLPPNVLDAILVLLPIRDAVRTSILSRTWRYRWTSISQLVFNKKCAPPPSCHPHVDCLQPADVVNRVLLCHKGPVHRFQCSQYLPASPYIDMWIVFLSNHRIKEFILHCLGDDRYKVLSHLFTCQDLRHLELTNCIVQPPPTSCCLASLTTLVLRSIAITSVALENLLSTSKLLTDLTLIDFKGPIHLKILALNLKKVHISGPFQGLVLDTPLLSSAEIYMGSAIEEEEEQTREHSGCNLTEVLGPLLFIERLEVKVYFLQSDPVKEEADDEEFVWEARGCALNCLNSMEIVGIRGSKNELALLEFVLATAAVMTTMTIQFSKDVVVPLEKQLKFLKSLIRSRRASSQATIICLDS